MEVFIRCSVGLPAFFSSGSVETMLGSGYSLGALMDYQLSAIAVVVGLWKYSSGALLDYQLSLVAVVLRLWYSVGPSSFCGIGSVETMVGFGYSLGALFDYQLSAIAVVVGLWKYSSGALLDHHLSAEVVVLRLWARQQNNNNNDINEDDNINLQTQ
ncbi:hypothetical protein PoB_006266800 [Plakobranchus ocellatus]|uniref:Uncharacterized protein n=1 Tax=Plakobranchus ocellatus TaxID=259542 RepID=A0AAV4CWA4_9GAST|nr:hypothetical protein PoB_006266800 [Plakobranchus ocellatus]